MKKLTDSDRACIARATGQHNSNAFANAADKTYLFKRTKKRRQKIGPFVTIVWAR